jgi:hypothetical protein
VFGYIVSMPVLLERDAILRNLLVVGFPDQRHVTRVGRL